MATARPNRSRARRAQLRETFFPDSSAYIWPQAEEEGWARVPRNIGLVLAIIDDIKDKGLDVTRTYLDLFAHNLGEGIVEVHHELDFALRAGLSLGDRGVRSWEERLEVLEELGFIRLHRGASKRIEFVVLVHPRKAVKQLRRNGRVKENLWNSYLQSLLDFDPDQTDVNEPMAAPEPSPIELFNEKAPEQEQKAQASASPPQPSQSSEPKSTRSLLARILESTESANNAGSPTAARKRLSDKSQLPTRTKAKGASAKKSN